MGTSRSFRSPSTPRWQALNAAYDAQMPLERLRVLVFAAGEESWKQALADPSVGASVQTLTAAFDDLGRRIEASGRADTAIADVVRDARNALAHQGFTPAAAVVERALRVVLVRAVQGDAGSLAEISADQAASSWQANRGSEPAHLVQRLLGEVLGQYARHVVTRDAHRLVGSDAAPTVGDARQLSRDVAASAAAVAERVAIPASPPGDLGATWPSLVAAAFTEGKRPPDVDA
jgi:hypothetical protein